MLLFWLSVGGVMGYKKKRSKDSLIASSIIAGLLLFSAYLMGKPNTTYGIRLALGMQEHACMPAHAYRHAHGLIWHTKFHQGLGHASCKPNHTCLLFGACGPCSMGGSDR